MHSLRLVGGFRRAYYLCRRQRKKELKRQEKSRHAASIRQPTLAYSSAVVPLHLWCSRGREAAADGPCALSLIETEVELSSAPICSSNQGLHPTVWRPRSDVHASSRRRHFSVRLESENGAERAGADSTLGLPPAAGEADELAAVEDHGEADAEAEAEAETTLRLQDDLAKAAELRLLTAMGWPGGVRCEQAQVVARQCVYVQLRSSHCRNVYALAGAAGPQQWTLPFPRRCLRCWLRVRQCSCCSCARAAGCNLDCNGQHIVDAHGTARFCSQDGQDEDDELEDDEGIPAEEIQKWQSANPEDHVSMRSMRVAYVACAVCTHREHARTVRAGSESSPPRETACEVRIDDLVETEPNFDLTKLRLQGQPQRI